MSTNQMTESAPPPAEVAPRTGALRRRLTRVAAILGVATTMGLGVAAVPAEASAGSYGGVGSATISCGYSGLYADVRISQQTGYTSNQNVAYRLYVKDLTTGAAAWSGWTSFTAAYRSQSWRYPFNHTYQLYVQYAWLRSSGWVYSGEWKSSYIHRTGYGYTYTSYCDEW